MVKSAYTSLAFMAMADPVGLKDFTYSAVSMGYLCNVLLLDKIDLIGFY